MIPYRPRISIRDFGTPTHRLLAFVTRIATAGSAARFIRALWLRVISAGSPSDRLLLEGDQQSGTDVLLLEGDQTGSLALSSSETTLTEGIAARFVRSLIIRISVSGTASAANVSRFVRSLKVHVSSGATITATNSAAFIQTGLLLLEGDVQSGTDTLLLEGDEQSGTDHLSLYA